MTAIKCDWCERFETGEGDNIRLGGCGYTVCKVCSKAVKDLMTAIKDVRYTEYIFTKKEDKA